jgi:DnaJ domain/Tetratricopeptide repeat
VETTGGGVPTAIRDVDIRRLPIGPTEAFVLSRVDGRSDMHEISLTTGFSGERVVEAVRLLVQLGAVTCPGMSIAQSEAPAASRTTPVPENDALTNDSTDLTDAQRRRIEALVRNVADKNFYELLGLARDADRSQVKDAYFALVADVHPDRFFGKDLGELKTQLERLFKRLTEAHDTLTRSRRRTEYDASLPPEVVAATGVAATVAVAMGVTPTVVTATPHDATPPASSSLQPDSLQPDSLQPGSGRASSGQPSSKHAVPVVVAAPPGHGDSASHSRPLRSTPPKAPPLSSHSSSRLSALQRSLPPQSRPAVRPSLPPASLRSPAQRYLDAADVARQEGNGMSALNSLRIAATILPQDETLKTKLSELEVEVDRQQLEKLVNDARQAEENGDPALAVRLHGRIVRATPTTAHFRRGAECALAAGMHQQAADFVRRALGFQDKDLQLRVLLGRIYFEAGMRSSAEREFERALELAPDAQTVKDWLKRIKRGDV